MLPVPAEVGRRGSAWGVPVPSPVPPLQDTVGDARIRSISDLSLQLKNRDPEEVKIICQRRSQLNSRPVPGWGEPRGRERDGGPPRAPHYTTTPRPGGRVSMATCSNTSSGSKGPWKYTCCLKSWTVSPRGFRRRYVVEAGPGRVCEQRRSGEGALPRVSCVSPPHWPLLFCWVLGGGSYQGCTRDI